MYIFLILLPCVFANIEYGYIAKTTSGKPCLNTCKNGYCYTDYKLNTESCIIDYLAGVPTYFTTMYEGNIPTCLSNCNKFGYDYEWCFTTKNYDWDYCSSKIYNENDKNEYDIYGYKCLLECEKDKHYTCLSSLGDERYCAKSAIITPQSCSNAFKNGRHFVKRGLDKIFLPKYCSYACRLRITDARDGYVHDLIDGIYNSDHSIENVTNITPPFTFAATRNATNNRGETVYLPVIIQATMRQISSPVPPRTSSDITQEARNNVRNMYNGDLTGIDVGHMISFQNGGTSELFNFVGQTGTLNRGAWKIMENYINNQINFENGTVEMTIVVVYSGTIPAEFAVKMKFFNGDGSLHSDCLDMIFKNI
jgi:hypothetical protein